MIRVAVCGAAGRMGSETVRAVEDAEDLELVAQVDWKGGKGLEKLLATALKASRPHVCVEFTHPSSAVENALLCLDAGVAPVVGTSGIDSVGLERIRKRAENSGVPAMVVPNFAIGAVLMMRFAETAAKWMPHVEIVEMHHDQKADAPSGTAMLTAERIGAARGSGSPIPETKVLKAEGARGGVHCGVPIHSVRLQGLLAHQLVMLGAPGEVLTIRHDSTDRAGFMPGVLLAVRKVGALTGLTIGLDQLLFVD